MFHRRLTFVSLVFLAALTGRAQTASSAANATATPAISLYFVPDTSAPAAAQWPANDPRLGSAKPSPDAAQAAAGWQVVSLSEPFTGYAPTNTSRKDLDITPGTPIHQSPDASSAVIGTAQSDPGTTVQNVSGDWAQVTFPGPVSLFFLGSPPAPPPPPPPAPPPAPVLTEAPVAAPAAPAVSATPSTGRLPRYYLGILQLRTDDKISGPSSAKYVLYGPDGLPIAIVDMNAVILPTSMQNYLGRYVKIYGVPEASNDMPGTLLRAQLVQLN
jgi:hypothetical protein